ncbi:methylmalonyl-CoA mutase subunit beta [bacterium SCSIO 12741]|nr:methylmalonyl-CoA mutase subunit beta [bacterium SCSIO 12741]
MNKDRFFHEFPPVSKEDWVAKIQKDLKGKPYESLQHQDLEGDQLDPVWHASDRKDWTQPNIPERDSITPWMINEQIQVQEGNPEEANRQALDALSHGANSITFAFSSEKKSDWEGALKDILPQYVHLGFAAPQKSLQLGEHLQAVLPAEAREQFSMHLENDPIGVALENGNWQQSSGQDLVSILETEDSLITTFPKLRVATVRGELYHNAGADAATELAASLATCHEYLLVLTESGLEASQAANHISIRLASGTDYFKELAKFRAMRMLWNRLVQAYDPKAFTGHIQAVTSQFFSTVYDPYNNMLRGTTQAMSAILGGADLLRILPFNTAWKEGDHFARRIARNTQLLMQEEAHLGKVTDPASGSYYLEHLTRELAQEAWKQFQEMEAQGGIISLIESGQLQEKIHTQAQEKIAKADSDEWPVLGVNLYPNDQEKMIDEIQETEFTDEPIEPAFTPLQSIRLVGEKEMQRLSDELNSAE